ncbi:methylmalonyl-CoA mutase subunit beta [Halocola ammonii]
MDKKNDLSFNEFSALSKEQWKEKVLKDLKGKAYESIIWENENGFSLEPYFSAEEVDLSQGVPGEFPYERGGDTNNRHWQICQEIFDNNPKKANEKAHQALMGGATALWFRAPVQKAEDVAALLKDVVLDVAPIYLEGGTSPIEIVKEISSLCDNQSVKSHALSGGLNYDPLGEISEQGGEKDKNWKSTLLDLSAFAREKFTLFHTVNVDSTLFQEAGATAAEELGLALAKGNEYLELMKAAGQEIDSAAAQLQFTMAIDSSYFTEMAKFRAFRPLWATVVKAHEPKHECSTYSFVSARTSQRNFTVPDAYNNMVRSTTEGMSAILGGVNAVSILPFDHLFDEENGFSMRIARNLQTMLAEESFLNQVVDPAGGSYYIEEMTGQLKVKAWKLFQEIEKAGGYLEALQSGMIQNLLKSSRDSFLKRVELEKETLIGVNKYFNQEDEVRTPKTIDEKDTVGDFEPVKRIFPGLEVSTQSEKV